MNVGGSFVSRTVTVPDFVEVLTESSAFTVNSYTLSPSVSVGDAKEGLELNTITLHF